MASLWDTLASLPSNIGTAYNNWQARPSNVYGNQILNTIGTGAVNAVNSAASLLNQTPVLYTDPTALNLQQSEQARLEREMERANNLAQQRAMQVGYQASPEQLAALQDPMSGVRTTPETQQQIQNAIDNGYGQDTIAAPNTNLEAQIPNVKPFTYNWADEQRTAYDALQSFYDKLLKFASGDLNLAKRMLEYTYQQGNREALQQYEEQQQEFARLFPQEKAGQETAQNRRGTYFSGFGEKEREDLGGNQDLRKLQVQRALENQQSRLGKTRGFQLEESTGAFDKTKFDLERQRRKEADQMAQQKYGIKANIYEQELTKQQQEEARRVQGIANNATTGIGTPGASIPGQPKAADTSGKLYGGWYDNPTTGRNQRYWGNGNWTDGNEPN